MIDPAPPVVDLSLPWDGGVGEPTELLAAARAKHGDTFSFVSGDTTYLFVFSPNGLRSFYALDENEASKGVADWQMLRRKVPDELFDGRRTLPHELFTRPSVAGHLRWLDVALEAALDELGDAGSVDVFDYARRLGHRVGLCAWGPGVVLEPDEFDRIVAALDALDPSEAFVHPGDMAKVASTDKAAEQKAMATAESILIAARDRWSLDEHSHPYDAVVSAWVGVDDADDAATGIASDVILVHLASMSNLFSALGWVIVHRLEHGGGENPTDAALESIRLMQRSIMMRMVLSPVLVETEDEAYTVQPGAIIATHLPVLNTTVAPGLDRFDAAHFHNGRLAVELDAREQVTTFGHGAHACPAKPFSLSVMERSLHGLFDRFTLKAPSSSVGPLPGQIGGVARPDGPYVVAYRRR